MTGQFNSDFLLSASTSPQATVFQFNLKASQVLLINDSTQDYKFKLDSSGVTTGDCTLKSLESLLIPTVNFCSSLSMLTTSTTTSTAVATGMFGRVQAWS